MVEEREDASTLRKAKSMDDDGISKKIANIETVRQMKTQFSGHIIRRTPASLDWQGNPLLTLPPHKDVIGILTLTQREIDIINERAKIAKARYVIRFPEYSILTFLSVISANESGKFLTRVQFKTFYSDPCI
jgi:TATA-binding protein-associated factor